MHTFRRKLWTSTYLSLESYLPACKRGWCWEFVEMKIRDLQSLLVCSIIIWRISSTEDDWIFGWLSRLASLILILCSPFTPFHCGWMKRTPWSQFLRIRCWKWRIWIYKNVSRYTMCVPNAWRPLPAARRHERMSQHSFRNWMRWEWHWSTGNVEISTAYWFSVLKVLRIAHTIDFILIEYRVVQYVPSISISEPFENTLWQISHGFQFFFCDVMVINAWSWYFVELLSRPVCQLTVSFHTFLGMTLHIIGPRTDSQIFRVWQLFSSPCGNSRFEHGSVIVHNFFVFFTLSLNTSQVYMIKEWCWFSQINFFVEYFPHRINILFLSSQFHVIHIHR